MEDETEYDSTAHADIGVCQTCEQLTERLRNEVARLRRLSEPESTCRSPHDESQRENLIRCRDSALEELAEHQGLHSAESGHQIPSSRTSEMSDENRDWVAPWKESKLKDAPIAALE
jgi:hypothetical protein